MKLQLLLISGVISLAQAVSFFELVLEEWESYKMVHSKGYENEVAEKFRVKIYMENKQKIAKHNAKASRGDYSYRLAMNEYGDLLHHEFVAQMNGFKRRAKNNTKRPLGATFMAPAHVYTLPTNVDWRTLGAVTPVKNQGMCGSCWSFSTTGALEAQHYRKTGILTSLSEQNLVDCAGGVYGNQGCNGGLMDNAFQYIKDNGGIDTEESYPYEGEENRCRYNPKNKGAWDVGFLDVIEGDEHALKTAIAVAGPCSVAIDAGHESLQFYSHGVYRDQECSPENLNHGVLAVGYGVERNGEAYWLIKNSWGTTWGNEGYFKMARNEGNMCGIATCASIPLV